MKRVYAREEYCLGCRLCEIHCIVKHSKSKKIIKAYRSERNELVPGVRVESSGAVSFAVQCRHCDDAPCIDACITGAMRRDTKTGAVICDDERCVGCWSCVMVCPAGAARRSGDGKAVSKCDMCMEDETPVCVLNCPNEALLYEER